MILLKSGFINTYIFCLLPTLQRNNMFMKPLIGDLIKKHWHFLKSFILCYFSGVLFILWLISPLLWMIYTWSLWKYKHSFLEYYDNNEFFIRLDEVQHRRCSFYDCIRGNCLYFHYYSLCFHLTERGKGNQRGVTEKVSQQRFRKRGISGILPMVGWRITEHRL